MDAKGKAIRVNAASIVDLKAELIRKQGEFKKEKLQPSTTAKPKVSSKQKGGIFNKSNAGVAERSQRDVEQQAEDRKNHDKSRAALEEKAKLYDQMMKGNTIPDEDGSGVFLVDFQKKVLDSVKAQAREDAGKGQSAEGERLAAEEDAGNDDIPEPSDPEEQWVDYVDSLGRSRRCMKKDLAALQDMDRKLGPEHSQGSKDLMSADMIREEQRQKWEQEEQEALSRPVGPVHYQQVRHNEVRDMGVGYYAFSKEETERQKQMETLSMLREETQDQRVKREKLKEKRKAALQARLAKVKQRKAKRLKGEGARWRMKVKTAALTLVLKQRRFRRSLNLNLCRGTRHGDSLHLSGNGTREKKNIFHGSKQRKNWKMRGRQSLHHQRSTTNHPHPNNKLFHRSGKFLGKRNQQLPVFKLMLKQIEHLHHHHHHHKKQ
ncbi:coiled-coil domain-containing protein 174-like isoform X5 [Branchiostoma floridae]|uniref:Coiled-coil domain-containing protein 174-like isoform X5 n=1 Tax=Branchiostoma floridae TaxID=7739 RepID=A0A9J7N164_BRAFL|nr:coiled-coil domain-containing protein 174-like isoform X5 [Branchiostoma floridae]